MQNRTVSYRVSLLPQAEHPENLYKRSHSYTTLPEKPKAAAPILNRSTDSPIPQPPRLESSRPRQFPAIGQQQLDEAQAIAQRVQDTPGSSRLEFLLSRQESKRYEHWRQQPLRALEHLAIARRPDQRYQLIIRGTRQVIVCHAFETVEYCAEAAAELERTFALAGLLRQRPPETMERLDELVQEHWLREKVAMVLG
jgi:hypothetical protein